jgi:predicted DNA-binding transcriptional regulator YafY
VKAVSTDERREEIIRILLGGEMTTAPKLAMQFDVNVRTIYRDLVVLTVERGYPIDTVAGRTGGVFMHGFRHAHKRILSQRQITALAIAIEAVDHETAETLQSILHAYA